MRDAIIINRDQAASHQDGENTLYFCCCSSDLGLRPGEWPKFVFMRDQKGVDVGQAFYRVNVKTVGGETHYADYNSRHANGGTILFRIFND